MAGTESLRDIEFRCLASVAFGSVFKAGLFALFIILAALAAFAALATPVAALIDFPALQPSLPKTLKAPTTGPPTAKPMAPANSSATGVVDPIANPANTRAVSFLRSHPICSPTNCIRSSLLLRYISDISCSALDTVLISSNPVSGLTTLMSMSSKSSSQIDAVLICAFRMNSLSTDCAPRTPPTTLPASSASCSPINLKTPLGP